MAELATLIGTDPDLAPAASPGLRRLASALSNAPAGVTDAPAEAAFTLLRASLDIVVRALACPRGSNADGAGARAA